MLVSDLTQSVKLASAIANPGSLTPLYRSIELGPSGIRAVSEFGNIAIMCPVEGLAESALLEAASLQAVLSSLDTKDSITFTRKEAAIHWRCGDARGHWMTVQQEHQIPRIHHKDFPWHAPEGFADALTIASSACLASAVSLGLYGVQLQVAEGADSMSLVSSNSIALAYTELPAGVLAGKELTVTLRPPVPAVLSQILSAVKNVDLDFTADGIYVMGDGVVALLPSAAPLGHNLLQVVAKHTSMENIAAVNTAALKKFLSRARTLSDKKQSIQVGLRVDEGKLVLEHRGLTASSEEFFLAEGLDPSISYSSVSLPLDLLITPLSYADGIVLDYLPKNILIMIGEKYNFIYILGGGGK